MASNWDRFRIRKMAANPLALPKIPNVPQEVKDKLPTLRDAFRQMEASQEKWRQETQRTIEQNFMALKLDTGEKQTVVKQIVQQQAAEPTEPLRGYSGQSGATGKAGHGPNLVVNPSFEDLTPKNAWTAHIDSVVDNSEFYDGSRSIRMDNTGADSYTVLESDPIRINPDLIYRAGVAIKSTGHITVVRLVYYSDANGTVVCSAGSSDIATVYSASDWEFHSKTFGPLSSYAQSYIPTDCRSVRITCYFVTDTAEATSCWLDSFQLLTVGSINDDPPYNLGVGAEGQSGYSGYSGKSGYSGASGVVGFSGVSGYSGIDGVAQSGLSGYSGVSGYSGLDGAAAASGYSGQSGVSGYSGESGAGISGTSGYSGYSGSGISGYSGEQGLSGYSGLNGLASASGYSGASGASGVSGYSGIGTSGYSGLSGYSGQQGLSGYSGLNGIASDSGYSGASGASGASGISGVGISGYSGSSGYSGISGYSGTGTQGVSGFSGLGGASGTSGCSGYSGVGTSGYSGSVNSFKLFIPRVGNLCAFGDSQTAGVNAAAKPYTSAGYLLPAYRWPNLISTRRDRALSLSNYGVGGTKLSWTGGENPSIFNMTGNLDYNWSGVAVAMAGWNNLDAGTTTDAFFDVLQRAHEAFIAKLLLDDYAGISFVGWGRNGSPGGAGLYSWVTDGSNGNETLVSPGNGRNVMPFYYGDANGARYRTNLTGTNYLTFTLASKRAIALFYEHSSDGGPFSVLVNGETIFTGTSAYTNIGGNDAGTYPGVVWIENPPDNAVVRLEANVGAGHVYFLAFGWVDKDSLLLKNKKVIYGSVCGNTANGRSNTILYKAGERAEIAAGAFGDYPVFFANTYTFWVNSTDQEPTDISHLTDVGNEHVYDAFEAATKVTTAYSPNIIRFNQFQDLSAYSGYSGSSGYSGARGVGPNLVANPSFEDFSLFNGWTKAGSVSGTDSSYHGSYSAKTIATGLSNIFPGAYTNPILIDTASIYRYAGEIRVTGYVSGDLYASLTFYSDVNGLTPIVQSIASAVSGDQDWTRFTVSIGSGGDIAIPVGTLSVRLSHFWYHATNMCEGVSYLDAVQFQQIGKLTDDPPFSIGVGAEGTSGYSGASGYSGESITGLSGASGYSGISVSGYSGAVGLSGYSGAVGDPGQSGASGYSGLSGYSGCSGVSGSSTSGYSGESGYSGTSGLSGYSGLGLSGASGYSGLNGIASDSGYSGASGYSGIGTSGYSGVQGVSGVSGYSGMGLSGASGYSGLNGLAAASGYSGESGISGYSGASTSGYSGFSGVSGYSGQSVSGQSGYSGTSTSGYSGASGYSGSGISGYSGAIGPSGYSGQDGAAAASGYSGSSGYSGLSGKSGYSGQSVSGTSGYSGLNGIGFPGTSGYSGCSGYSGASGYSGCSGEPGPTGSGVSGYSGASGYSGYSGLSGYSGTRGISGFSGMNGSGVSGYSGISGYSGRSGYSGSGISGYSGRIGSGQSGYSGLSGASGYSGIGGDFLFSAFDLEIPITADIMPSISVSNAKKIRLYPTGGFPTNSWGINDINLSPGSYPTENGYMVLIYNDTDHKVDISGGEYPISIFGRSLQFCIYNTGTSKWNSIYVNL